MLEGFPVDATLVNMEKKLYVKLWEQTLPCSGIHVITTEYLRYLRTEFGFEQDCPLKILHAVFYKHAPFLKTRVDGYLTLRRELKMLGDAHSLAKAEFYKLLLNGVYGFSLCRLHDMNTPYCVEVIRNRNYFKRVKNNSNVIRVLPVGTKHVAVLSRKGATSTQDPMSPLVSVGANILNNSKICLLRHIGFLLRYLDPRLAEHVYTDTDSIFLVLAHKQLVDNVCPALRSEFQRLLPEYIDCPDKLAGYLVKEKESAGVYIFGEKMYALVDDGDGLTSIRMKGVGGSVAQSLTPSLANEISASKSMCMVTNLFKRPIDGHVELQTSVKRFRTALQPVKRFFHGQHSQPWV